MENLNIEVSLKVEIENLNKSIEENNKLLDNIIDNETRKKCELIKRLSSEEQRKWASKTIRKIAEEYRGFLKEREYIE